MQKKSRQVVIYFYDYLLLFAFNLLHLHTKNPLKQEPTAMPAPLEQH